MEGAEVVVNEVFGTGYRSRSTDGPLRVPRLSFDRPRISLHPRHN